MTSSRSPARGALKLGRQNKLRTALRREGSLGRGGFAVEIARTACFALEQSGGVQNVSVFMSFGLTAAGFHQTSLGTCTLRLP